MDNKEKIPQHIGFIMDGNGRWASKKGLTRNIGHKFGVETLKKALDYCYKIGIKIVSIYAFSTENWARPVEEVEALISLLDEYLSTAEESLIKNQVRFNIMGDISALPESTQVEIERIKAKTANFGERVLNIGFNYSGRAELVTAVNRMIEQGVTQVNEQIISDFLYTSGQIDPDLIIRTSGEQRLSNFMLYQAAYSELYFTKTLWPDLSERTIKNAITAYNKRKRRFGKIQEDA